MVISAISLNFWHVLKLIGDYVSFSPTPFEQNFQNAKKHFFSLAFSSTSGQGKGFVAPGNGKLKIAFPFYEKGTGIRKYYGKGREI